jgi:hypothetical protein
MFCAYYNLVAFFAQTKHGIDFEKKCSRLSVTVRRLGSFVAAGAIHLVTNLSRKAMSGFATYNALTGS